MQSELRKKIGFTLFILILARIGIYIPVSGINHSSLYKSFENNILSNIFNLISGGGSSTIGLFSLGIAPYINASIIIQIGIKIIPFLEDLQTNEGESGRKKITQITRIFTFLWSIIQSCFITLWLKPYVFNWDLIFIINTVISLTTGAIIILWLGEMITQKGLGNGYSLLVFHNIISSIPYLYKTGNNHFSSTEIFIITVVWYVVIIGAIFLQEGVKCIQIISLKQLSFLENYTKNNYIPFKLNHGNIMPLILSSGTITFETFIANILIGNQRMHYKLLFYSILKLYRNLSIIIYIFFSYLYSTLTRNPKEISKVLKNQSVSIIGVKPGKKTTFYLSEILSQLTFIGSIFCLFGLAIVPYLASSVTHLNVFQGIGVTSLMILVGVAIDVTKQIRTYTISAIYDEIINNTTM
uniref:Protein translocase subunit SecY n=1 Tax=Bulboplastis apyrenoidosa TaxID=1070855 RepID=A0A1X9PTP3_9RHOD|nr:preprotein translocase secY subunit [Bulboplastis apyrenoidosa]ARO90819.1 preprotein translocase secY subunit [Bulboplastis apyrenoidosa]